MRPHEDIRHQVRERLNALLAERQRDRLADRAASDAPPSPGRRLVALAGLGLIRLGERLRGERWMPAPRLASRERVSRA